MLCIQENIREYYVKRIDFRQGICYDTGRKKGVGDERKDNVRKTLYNI